MADIQFSALQGKMGDSDFYFAVMSLLSVSRFFEPTSSALPAELRAQRPLNERRVPEIAQYLLDHDKDWVFASLTVAFNGNSTFRSLEELLSPLAARADAKDLVREIKPTRELGLLTLDASTEFTIVDGQHRLAAIKQAIDEDPTLRNQQIGVMLIPFESLDRNQQIFSDLNRTVQKTSRSLDILYDHSDPLNDLVKTVASRVPLFNNRVEKNATSLALRSPKFVTLSSLYDACRELLGGPSAVEAMKGDDSLIQAAEDLCVDYWNELSELIGPWRDVLTERIRPSEARVEFIVAHSVAFYALGVTGARVLGISSEKAWRKPHDFSQFKPLADVDWLRTNRDWQGIVMLGPSVVTRRQTRQALARMLTNIIDPKRFPPPERVLDAN